MSLISRLITCALLAFFASGFARADTTSEVLVYYSSTSEFQSTLASILRSQLKQTLDGVPAEFITNFDLSKVQADSLVVSIGNHDEIDENIRNLPNSVMYVHNTRPRQPAERNNSFYANIIIDQPACRHLRLIKTVNSDWEYVGYLSSSSKDDRLAQLQQCAGRLGLEIINASINDESGVPDATDRLLRDSDVLLALPDSTIYNSHSVKNILLSAYRHRIPVIGFSDNFVRAGALAAVYSTPTQLVKQLASLISQKISTGIEQQQGSTWPEYYSVSINKQVAKSLDIVMPDEAAIENKLHETEVRP